MIASVSENCPAYTSATAPSLHAHSGSSVYPIQITLPPSTDLGINESINQEKIEFQRPRSPPPPYKSLTASEEFLPIATTSSVEIILPVGAQRMNHTKL